MSFINRTYLKQYFDMVKTRIEEGSVDTPIESQLYETLRDIITIQLLQDIQENIISIEQKIENNL